LQRGRGLGQLQRTPVNVNTGFDQRLVVGTPGTEVGILVVVPPALECLGCLVDEHGVLHRGSPVRQSGHPLSALTPMTSRRAAFRHVRRKTGSPESRVGARRGCEPRVARARSVWETRGRGAFRVRAREQPPTMWTGS